jgi:phosphatidate cytidylyltransferase
VLKTRVLTAVAILLVLLGMVFWANAPTWSLFVLAVALAGSWEWSRLCKLGDRAQVAFLALSGVIGAGAWLSYLRLPPGEFLGWAVAALVVSAIFWFVVAPLWLARLARPGPLACAAAGLVVVWPTWFAFVLLRGVSPWLLLAVAALVWIADIAAYFAGRAFGKRKLAPAISPGKTWAGVGGAVAGVVAYGVVLALFATGPGSPLAPLFAPAAGVAALAFMAVLTALSITGDLFESWMKRGAGLKDSSNLLPGHGGILDRIDALTSTLPVATLAIVALTRA